MVSGGRYGRGNKFERLRPALKYVLLGLLGIATVTLVLLALQGEQPSIWGIWLSPLRGRP